MTYNNFPTSNIRDNNNKPNKTFNPNIVNTVNNFMLMIILNILQ